MLIVVVRFWLDEEIMIILQKVHKYDGIFQDKIKTEVFLYGQRIHKQCTEGGHGNIIVEGSGSLGEKLLF